MFKNLKLIFKKNNKDIRKRLGFTLMCLFIFVVGTTIPVPGVSLKDFDFAVGKAPDSMHYATEGQFSPENRDKYNTVMTMMNQDISNFVGVVSL